MTEMARYGKCQLSKPIQSHGIIEHTIELNQTR